MTISNVLKEHLNGKLDKLQANALYNETKRKELEDALKLISPSYEVRLRSSCSGDRKELDLSVGFGDNRFLPFHVQVVKRGDIHISDTDMELLLDYPNMQVGSPALNAGLKNFLAKTVYCMLKVCFKSNITKEELKDFRTYMLEKTVQIDSDPQGLYEELRQKGVIKDQSMLSAVRESRYVETGNPITVIDDAIDMKQDRHQHRETKLELMHRVVGERSHVWSFVTEGAVTSVCNYNRKGPTPKGGPHARGPFHPDMDVAFMYGGMPEALPSKGVSVTVTDDYPITRRPDYFLRTPNDGIDTYPTSDWSGKL